MEIELKKGRKKVFLDAKKVSLLGKISGLMFHFRKGKSRNLLFEFNKPVSFPIHSYFVFFKFLAVWVDGNNKIIEYKIVKPFTLSVKPRRQFRKLFEIPLNQRNRKVVKNIVGKMA